MEPQKKEIAPKRYWIFRCAAVVLGVSLFVFAEGVCRLLNIGSSLETVIVQSGFGSSNPLFVLDQSSGLYHISKSRLKFFVPESFPARKVDGTFRVFCIGGSTVQGRPYSKETAFPAWLELSLEQADPSRGWEVINCGGVSYASYRLVPILQECLLNYEPDLIILCTGHNEFLEERSYRYVRRAPDFVIGASEAVMGLRISRLMQSGYRKILGTVNKVPQANPLERISDADALLDYRNGLKAFQRDEALQNTVIKEFEFHLRQMHVASQKAKVPVLLVRPPSNLRDSPPFKSQHRDGLTKAQLMRWTNLVQEASTHTRTDLRTAASLFNQAIGIDDQFAHTYYSLGKCYVALGIFDKAKQAFLKARELDVCPLRILQPMESVLVQVAEEIDAPLIDAHSLLEQKSEWGILGNDWLVDHVHPSIRGHQLIADALLDEMERLDWVEPIGDWKSTREDSYKEHFGSLDELYFLHGQQRLENLRAWTQGMADGPPIEDRLERLR